MTGSRAFPFAWLPVGGGRLALWHRPKLRAVPYLGPAGCDRVVTLLAEREGAREVGAAVEAAGLRWSWIPLESGRPPEGRRSRAFVRELERLRDRLGEGESILLHCSAGIHRTGMAALVLLLLSGTGEEDALESVERMRSHTRGGLRPRHVEWARRAVAEAAGRAPDPERSAAGKPTVERDR